MSDEPYSAERCEALGVGRAVGPAARSAEAVRDAVRTVLTDSSYRARADEFRAEMNSLPGSARIVELLTSLTAEHTRA
jgi:UDP:flavonoid glycosyltransferase YjiC (YdhE family)